MPSMANRENAIQSYQTLALHQAAARLAQILWLVVALQLSCPPWAMELDSHQKRVLVEWLAETSGRKKRRSHCFGCLGWTRLD